MPSRASKTQKKRRPQDPVLLAKSVMEDIIGEKWNRNDPKHPPVKNPHAQALSALGASKGGKARAGNPDSQSSAKSKIAKKAAKARWKKRPEAA